MMTGTEFQVPMCEPPETVTAALVAFDVFVCRRKCRYQNCQRQEFEIAVTENLFGEEVQNSKHGGEFAASAATPLILLKADTEAA
jgi:hypothetical protein